MSTAVSFDGTTVEKVGADVPLTFVVGIAGAWSKHESGQTAPSALTAVGTAANAINAYNATVGSTNQIKTSSWGDLIDSLGIKVTAAQNGDGHYCRTQSMGRGTRTDSSIKVKLTKSSIMELLGDFLNKNKNDYPNGKFTFQDSASGGGSLEIFGWSVSESNVTFTIGAQVAAYKAGVSGGLDSIKDDRWHSPAHGLATKATQAFSKACKIEICLNSLPAGSEPGQSGQFCPGAEATMKKIGFTPAGYSGTDPNGTKIPNGKYISDDYYKMSQKTYNDLNGETFWHYPHEGGTKTSVTFCKMTMDQLCAKLGSETDVDDDMEPYQKGVHWTTGEELQCPTGNGITTPCSVDAQHRRLIYEKLAEHLVAAGFTKILPNSFQPVIMNRQGELPDNSTYQFAAYDLTGEYTKVTDIASKSSKIWEVDNAKIGIGSIVPGSLKINKKTGAIEDYDTVKDLAFGTTADDVQRLNKDLASPDQYKFNAEVYANVVRTTMWQMAEVWRQTARLTLNDPRDDKSSINAKIIKDKLLLNGGKEQDVSVYGTKLDLNKILFGTFSSYVANAGVKIPFFEKLITFKSDITAREIQEDGTQGSKVSWQAESSITFSELINLITHTDPDGNETHNESNFKEQLVVNLPTIKDGAYNVEDITFTYDFTWWNNWKFEVVSPSDITDWASYGGSIEWEMDEGKCLTLSKFSDGAGYGLDLTWRIDLDKEPMSGMQKGVQSKIKSLGKAALNGAMLKSGFMYNPNTEKPEFSLELSKEISKGINASMGLTDMSVNAKFQKSYGENTKSGRGWGKADFGFTAGFGKSIGTLFKSGRKINEFEDTPSIAYEELFYNANLNLDIKGNLFRLGNALGTIVYDVSLRTSLNQISGVVRGVGISSVLTYQITLKNKIGYEILGLPANIHPGIGGAMGFTMHDVESTYFGTKYKDYKFSVGLGLFNFNIVPHSRKDVIQDIMERKKYATLKIPLIAPLLGYFDFFGWVSEEETDEDYIARAWPCIVYNVINWSREDYDKKLQTQLDRRAVNIDKSGHCEGLKSMKGVGQPLSDTYDKYFGCGTYSCGLTLQEEHARFFGWKGGYCQSINLQVHPSRIVGGEDRWVKWVEVKSSHVGKFLTFPEKPNAIPMLIPPRAPSIKIEKHMVGHWMDQGGNLLSSNIVRAVKTLNPNGSWANFPNMEPDMRFTSFLSGDADFLGSSQFAYLYMVREFLAFGGHGYCESCKKSESEPCSTLLLKWRINEVSLNQTREITTRIEDQLLTYKSIFPEELNGLNKERSITNSLWEHFYNWITGRSNRTYEFNIEDFLKSGKEPKTTLWKEAANKDIQGWAPVKNGVPWLASTHEVTTFTGATDSMLMLSLPVAKKVLQQGGKYDSTKDAESALTNMHTDPVWGLVKCYFSYMAPIGAENELVYDADKKKMVDNPKWLDAYDPRTNAAVQNRAALKQKEVEAVQKQRVLDVVDEDGNPTTIMIAGKNYSKLDPKRLKDRYGNLNVESHKQYRPGWVYRKRSGANGYLGEIVWVIPARSMYKHDHAIVDAVEGEGLTSKILKLAGAGGIYAGSKVSDTCTRHGQGGFLNFFKKLFMGSSREAYITLPWLYLDYENWNNNRTQRNHDSRTVNEEMIEEKKFMHYPAKNQNARLTNFPPAPMSYQEVPWKGNLESCYLNFYEFMEAVQEDALQYFYPESLTYLAPDSVNRFCITKEIMIETTGRFASNTILEECKSCNTCNLRSPRASDGSTDAPWGELVGLRSMLGTTHTANEDLNVQLDKSLSFENTNAWPEHKSSNSGGGMTYIYDVTQEPTNKNIATYIGFSNLYEKFAYIKGRIDSIREFFADAENVFANSALTQDFQQGRTFFYPDSINPTKTYEYNKGESITNAKELAALKLLVRHHSSQSSQIPGFKINTNVLRLQADFEYICSEPKYADRMGIHKYYDSVIAPDASSVGGITSQDCIGRNNCYCTTSQLAADINGIVKDPLISNLYRDFSNGIEQDIIINKWGQNYRGNDNCFVKEIGPSNDYLSNIYHEGNPEYQAPRFGDRSKTGRGTQASDALLISDLSTNYKIDSTQMLLNFLPRWKKIQWIYDPRNPDNSSTGVTMRERNSKKFFYDMVHADLLSSYYIVSLALQPWRHAALDLFINYWKKEISYESLIFNLNYRLWPLMQAYDWAAGKMYISKTNEQDIKKLGSRNKVTPLGTSDPINAGEEYLRKLNVEYGGYTTDPMESLDHGWGVAWSSPYTGFSQSTVPGRGSGFDFSKEDLVFRNRDNVLSLLFSNINPTKLYQLYKPTNENLIKLIREVDPLNNLFKGQILADNQILAEQHPQFDVKDYTNGLATAILNSLCSHRQESQAAGLGGASTGVEQTKFTRPAGRGRYTNSKQSFFPLSSVEEPYTSENGFDLEAPVPWIPAENLFTHKYHANGVRRDDGSLNFYFKAICGTSFRAPTKIHTPFTARNGGDPNATSFVMPPLNVRTVLNYAGNVNDRLKNARSLNFI